MVSPKLTTELRPGETSALYVDKMFATNSWVTIQREVCSPNYMNPTFQ